MLMPRSCLAQLACCSAPAVLIIREHCLLAPPPAPSWVPLGPPPAPGSTCTRGFPWVWPCSWSPSLSLSPDLASVRPFSLRPLRSFPCITSSPRSLIVWKEEGFSQSALPVTGQAMGLAWPGIPDALSVPQDLVKSHLMFAVREEVEVLKEQIRDLAERNAALEQENGLLRALASPEQLAQLPSSGVPRLGPPAPNGPSI